MQEQKLYVSLFHYKQRKDKKGNCPIILRLTLDQKRESINTGISVPISSWDNSKSRIKGNSSEVDAQNKLLVSLKSKVLSIYADLIQTGSPLSAAIVKAKFQGSDNKKVTLVEALEAHNAYVKKRVGIEATKATLTKYNTLESKVRAYVKKQYNRSDMLLSELNNAFIANFEVFLKVDEGISHNTTTKYLQFLKRVINYARSQDWLPNNPFQAYRCTFKPVTREVLTMTEIEALEQKSGLNERLRNVRDIFVFCCYTGLAYADVRKLSMSEIMLGQDNNLWVQTFRAKTTTRVSVPLLPKALALLQQYHEWRIETSTDKAFPVLSNQKMNAYLKELADVCGIKLTLTFHIARHTFATTVALSNGVPIETVSKMLGHTNIKTTQIYAKVLDTKISLDMASLKNKLQP